MAIYSKGNEFKSFAVFLWNMVLTYFDNLKILKSYFYLQTLEKSIWAYSEHAAFSLLKAHYQVIKVNYVSELSKPSTFAECIFQYNEIRERKYLSIATSTDFYYLIQDIIDKDIRKWVEMDGAYKLINDSVHKQEDLIQKTIKTQFENFLLKRGIRENEVHIRREEQMIDDTRTDFVLSYGFTGQVLIEIKRSNNRDVKNKLYYKKLNKYIESTKSDYGIFLIFVTEANKKWKDIEPAVLKDYRSYQEKIKVIGMDCNIK